MSNGAKGNAAMSDGRVVAMAGLAWLGCWVGYAVPLIVGVSVAGLALLFRSPRWLLLGVLALALWSGDRADRSYELLPAGPFEGTVDAVSLPQVSTFSERMEVRLPSGKRVLLTVPASAGSVRNARAGTEVLVVGRIGPIDETAWYRSRHLVGRLSAQRVTVVGSGGLHWRIAAGLQQTVERAGASFGPASAALYQGLVTGDDREQGAAQRSIFRKVGLSHILAVSGQNVAFVLLLLHLALGWLPGRMRPIAVAVGLGLFALVTQLEPSVLRATFTAGIGFWAMSTGRQGAGLRLLSAAVTVLLLVDPFLSRSLGFQLSVLASGGILLLGPVLGSRLRGPVWLTIPLQVTLAAQVAVLPLLLGSFGTVSLVSVPANLAAGWAVGPVMMWGMSFGLVAGWLGGSLGAALQLPVRPFLWWIDGVARVAADVPAPTLTAGSAMAATGLLLMAAVLDGWFRWLPVTLVLTVLATMGYPSQPAVLQLDGGGTLIAGCDSDGAVLVLSPGADLRVVAGIVNADPGPIDVVVVEGGNRSVSVIVRELKTVSPIDVILAPPQHTVVGGKRVRSDVVIPTCAGDLIVAVETDRRLTTKLNP